MADDVPRRGKTIDELKEGDSLTVTETLSERDLLLYLGVSNDTNPLYIQREYAQRTEYEEPVVPPIMLVGLITASISRLLPGPGSDVVNLALNFIAPVKHGATVTLSFEVIKVDKMKEVITISVEGTLAEQTARVLDAVVMVKPPKVIYS